MSTDVATKETFRDKLTFFINDVFPLKLVKKTILDSYRENIHRFPPTLGDIVDNVYSELFWDCLIFRMQAGEDLRYYGLEIEEYEKHVDQKTFDEYMDDVLDMYNFNSSYEREPLEMKLAKDVKLLMDNMKLAYINELEVTDILLSETDSKHHFSISNNSVVEVW